ncbi:BTB/POZ domain-containing protein, partial [Striga asiatica]
MGPEALMFGVVAAVTLGLICADTMTNKKKKIDAETCKGVKELKEIVLVQNEKINCLGKIVVAFMNRIRTDIEAVKSSIFRNILDSEDKGPPNESISLSELNNKELQSLLKFLYSGYLPKDMVEKHLYSLTMAANEYEPLRKVCEHHLRESLSKSNALDILEISDKCSNKSLKDTTLDFIATYFKDIIFSEQYDAFAIRNPHLAVEIARASFVFTLGAAAGGAVSALSAVIIKKKRFDAENCNINKPMSNLSPPSNSDKGFWKKFQRGNELKEIVEMQNEKINYLGRIVVAFMNGIHSTDIEVKPGNNEPSIDAHKALLALKSSIFRNILDSEDKAPPNESITLSELTNEELQSLLEFLYNGNLPKETVEKHLYLLTMAADKYDIAPLQKVCEHYLRESLSTSNALDILEISNKCSNKFLKDATLDFIATNFKDIIFNEGYRDFAIDNPHLAVEIIRARTDFDNNNKSSSHVGIA